MSRPERICPDCSVDLPIDRRGFLHTAAGAGAALATAGLASPLFAEDKPAAKQTPETLVKVLYDTLNVQQRNDVCFDWNHTEDQRGLLRTRVANNWHITKPVINSEYFTKEQKHLVRQIFEGMLQEEWIPKIDKQLKDDAGGFGNDQNIAIFGKPGEGKFELVMTGRHMTMRCDGNSTESMAFGGPIFYGHAAEGFNESENHVGNVFWEQALAANKVYQMLDEKQRKASEVKQSPREQNSGFRGKDGKFDGIPVSELSSDQKEEVQRVLAKLIEPYRAVDQEEVKACLKAQGGLDACHLAFYTNDDIGPDGVWDNWRLEGPSFVWYFRGDPHVHVWVNVGTDPSIKLNA